MCRSKYPVGSGRRRDVVTWVAGTIVASPTNLAEVFQSIHVHPHVRFSLEARSYTNEQKQRVIAEIRKLQGQIPGLVETHVGTNISPRGQGYELGGVMKFADQASLDAYGPHPVHQKLVSWLMPLIEPIEVDFEASA